MVITVLWQTAPLLISSFTLLCEKSLAIPQTSHKPPVWSIQ